jgi:hypothetical protein
MPRQILRRTPLEDPSTPPQPPRQPSPTTAGPSLVTPPSLSGTSPGVGAGAEAGPIPRSREQVFQAPSTASVDAAAASGYRGTRGINLRLWMQRGNLNAVLGQGSPNGGHDFPQSTEGDEEDNERGIDSMGDDFGRMDSASEQDMPMRNGEDDEGDDEEEEDEEGDDDVEDDDREGGEDEGEELQERSRWSISVIQENCTESIDVVSGPMIADC